MIGHVILAAAFVVGIGGSLLLLRGLPRFAWWLGGAVVMFVLAFAAAKALQDVPGEGAFAAAYADGNISYNAYKAGVAAATRANDISAIVGAGGALLTALFGFGFMRVRAYDDRMR
jgi:hypothetical protein